MSTLIKLPEKVRELAELLPSREKDSRMTQLCSL
jgi:hypothetical protein